MSYAIGQVRIESRQNILDLPEVFIPAEKTAFVVSNGAIVEEDGRYAVVRKSPAGRHEDEAAPDGCSVLVEYEPDDQFCRIVPLTEVAIALNALDAARRSADKNQCENCGHVLAADGMCDHCEAGNPELAAT